MATSLRQDMLRLRSLKRKAEAKGREKKEADSTFKKHQLRVLDRMETEDTDSIGTAGTLFSRVDKVKGNVTDRKAFVRWALEQDEGIQEFLQDLLKLCDASGEHGSAWVDEFYEAVMNTGLVEYKPDGTELNRIATAHVDDALPLPPGVDFYPDPYVSQKARG